MDQHRDVARRDSVAWAAQVALAQWMARVGDAGLAAQVTNPGLLAQVDQHAAEVRDALADEAGEIALTALAAYADGVNDVAAARGCQLAEMAGRVPFAYAPWPVVRILAVCQLARWSGRLD